VTLAKQLRAHGVAKLDLADDEPLKDKQAEVAGVILRAFQGSPVARIDRFHASDRDPARVLEVLAAEPMAQLWIGIQNPDQFASRWLRLHAGQHQYPAAGRQNGLALSVFGWRAAGHAAACGPSAARE